MKENKYISNEKLCQVNSSDTLLELLYFGEPIHHNDVACQALKEYESKAQYRDEYMYEQLTDDKGMKINGRRLNTKALPLVSMSEIAAKYGVTIDEMKQHWRCVENGG